MIDELKEKGNIIECYEQKKAKKVIPRKRIYTYNKMNQDQMREIGEQTNKKLLEKITMLPGKKKRECCQILSSLQDIGMEPDYQYQVNETNQTYPVESSVPATVNQLQQCSLCQGKILYVQQNENTSPNISTGSFQQHQSVPEKGIAYFQPTEFIQLPIKPVKTADGDFYEIVINNQSYLCQLIQDQQTNNIIPVVHNKQDGKLYTIVYDDSKKEFVFIPYLIWKVNTLLIEEKWSVLKLISISFHMKVME